MKTIEIYEQTETKELQIMLKQCETYLENGANILKSFGENIKNEDYQKLKNTMSDYEIDVSLIRMELNKRLWNNNL